MNDSESIGSKRAQGRGGVPLKHGLRRLVRNIRRIMASTLVAAVIFLLLFIFKNPVAAKSHIYSVARDIMKISLDLQTRHWYVIDGKSFRVKYQPADASVARLVLYTAEDTYQSVNEMLDFYPEGPVDIYIYPTKETLNKSFGWDASVNAMGVYWAGTIRILSPLDWIEDEAQIETIFRESGPLVHEYAHLLVDYRTHGNYPRWLTEGVAQYVERELTGYMLSSTTDERKGWYSFKDMDDDFDLLSDQSLAYQQSLLAVDYMVELGGFNSVLALLDELAQGKKISDALEETFGQNLDAFEVSFKKWTAEQEAVGN